MSSEAVRMRGAKAAVAKRLGVNQSLVSNYLTGKNRASLMMAESMSISEPPQQRELGRPVASGVG